ncbi:helix-turn-helix domain-containing protein [bacterium]|nr:MAG: helix-turn-helix domain-containing protein [bacterium]QQR62257.1 MAG: helix-turn-helix domain-containing protein [bacterium]QQR63177.1 MAG: helix-turn-helix domain-containing protein [bacterium]
MHHQVEKKSGDHKLVSEQKHNKSFMSQTDGKHLIYKQRCQIEVLLDSGHSKREIGRKLGISH